jgi:cytochrome c oxidase subunit IV
VSEHIEPKKTYLYVFAALISLTVFTTGIAYVDLGPFSVVVAMTIAVVKMLLVALFFMHLRYGTNLMKVVVVAGLLWLGILMALTMSDFVTRGWLPVPGK